MNCTFAHSEVELRGTPDLVRTELCWQWASKGKCCRGNACRFAHGKDELRPMPREDVQPIVPLGNHQVGCSKANCEAQAGSISPLNQLEMLEAQLAYLTVSRLSSLVPPQGVASGSGDKSMWWTRSSFEASEPGSFLTPENRSFWL